MSPAAAYVARGGTVQVNPNSLSGLVARYRASDLAALADGTALTTWADRSGQGNDLSVLSTAPVKQTASGQPCVRFTGASSQSMSKNSPTGLPASGGPITVLAVANYASTTNGSVMVEYAGTGAAGWACRILGGSYVVSNYSAGTTTGIGPVPGSVQLHMWQLASDDLTVTGRRNNRMYAASGNSGTLVAGTRTRLTVGRADFFPKWELSADVYELIVYNRILTDQEIDSLRPYFDATYGLKILGTRFSSATAFTTSPTADGSSSCVEMSVLYFPAGFGGHKYWMAMVPLGSGSAVNENPHIFYSDDNVTWSASGVTNPVVPAPSSGTNADPHLLDNIARDGKVYLYYTVTSATPTSGNGIWVKTSTNGTTWSAGTQVLVSVDGTANQEPTVRWDGSQYVLYTQDANTSTLSRRVSSSPSSGFGSATAVNLTVPGVGGVWHIDVQIANGKWLLAFSDNDSARNMWLATSPAADGVNFTCAKRPVLVPSNAAWEVAGGGTTVVYRPALLPPDDTTTNWRQWYTAGNVANGIVHVGYGEFPVQEFPNS